MDDGRNKEVIEIYCGMHGSGLHAIIVRIKLEMCINFAQVYLCDLTNRTL